MKRVAIGQKPMELYGLPWYPQNAGKLWRLPVSIKDMVSTGVWEQSTQPSGGRLRFCTDTGMLGISACYEAFGETGNMCRIGQAGVDAYVDGCFWNCVYPASPGRMEGMFFQNAPRKMRNITIYLPIYNEIDIEGVFFDDDAEILPPNPFRLEKPVVFYGTSITQGGCASRAGLSYQARLCRELDLDFVNLGFSGCGKGETVMARKIAELDAACYVLDYGQNNESVSELESVYYPFIEEIRKVRRHVPIILTTPIFYTRENWDPEFADYQNQKRNVVRNAYSKCVQSGDSEIYLVEWDSVMSLIDGEGQVDGAHPNDIGFSRMVGGIRGILEKVLGL